MLKSYTVIYVLTVLWITKPRDNFNANILPSFAACCTIQVLHHAGAGPGYVYGWRPSWPRGDGQDRDCQGHGALPGQVRLRLQLL